MEQLIPFFWALGLSLSPANPSFSNWVKLRGCYWNIFFLWKFLNVVFCSVKHRSAATVLYISCYPKIHGHRYLPPPPHTTHTHTHHASIPLWQWFSVVQKKIYFQSVLILHLRLLSLMKPPPPHSLAIVEVSLNGIISIKLFPILVGTGNQPLFWPPTVLCLDLFHYFPKSC